MAFGKRIKKCCSVIYDILTILVSIADVTTDIIVLVDFYQKERMSFFMLSLIILILAQCSYAMAFSLRFDIIDDCGFCKSCCIFCCVFPFGSLVAFCIYLADEDCFDVGPNIFSSSSNDSTLTKWIKQKLNKHIGFILEALIEAFPQSLIQITAIVYYHEANIISVISILISMASVMSKSLILSQGVETFTFIWTWLCAVTDFFGIFFTLTWVFYSHDSITSILFGYFNIFGAIWLIKTFVSILLPAALGLAAFFLVAYWFGFGIFLYDNGNVNPDWCKIFGYCLLWLMFAPLCAILTAFCMSLAAEVMCFVILALFVYIFSTDRISAYETTVVGEMIDFIFTFISNTNNGQNDRIMRILSVNWALSKWGMNKKIGSYIQKNVNQGHYDALKEITYRDIRQNSASPLKANLPKHIINDLINDYNQQKTDAHSSTGCGSDCFFEWLGLIVYVMVFFIFFPIYLVSKVVQILYPWFILGYLLYNDLLLTQQIDLFQLTMLAIYILLQLILLFIGVYVLRLHWWLWHISPGVNRVSLKRYDRTVAQLKNNVHEFYEDIIWFPKTEELVLKYMGGDIGTIVMDYVKSIKLDE